MLRVRQKRRPAPSATGLEACIRRLRLAEPVLIEDRRRQLWLVISSAFVTPPLLAQMQRDAGGRVCLALGRADYLRLGLPPRPDAFAAGADIEVGCPISLEPPDEEDPATLLRKVLDTLENGAPFPLRIGQGLATLLGDPDGPAARNGIAELSLALLSLAGIPVPALLCGVIGATGHPAGLETLAEDSPLAGRPALTAVELLGAVTAAADAASRK